MADSQGTDNPGMDAAPVSLVQIMAVVALAVCWAFNWPMMKLALVTVDPWTFRAFLVVVGGVGCAFLAKANGLPLLVHRSDWPAMIAVGLLQGALWNGFSGFGIALVDASRAAVLAFTMPLWVTLLSMIFLREVVTPRRFFGLGLGLCAITLLLMPAFAAMGSALFGTLLMLLAAFSWGAATVVFKGATWKSDILTISVWQYIIGGVPLCLAAVTLGDPPSLIRAEGWVLLAIAYSALVPMIFCQIIWFSVVQRVPASYASMGTLMVPVLGVMFSAMVLGEKIGPPEIGALVLVTVAMALILPGVSLQASRRPPRASRPE
ncbi:MAG: DMT family transporter [Pseudomonadota bacterium]